MCGCSSDNSDKMGGGSNGNSDKVVDGRSGNSIYHKFSCHMRCSFLCSSMSMPLQPCFLPVLESQLVHSGCQRKELISVALTSAFYQQ